MAGRREVAAQPEETGRVGKFPPDPLPPLPAAWRGLFSPAYSREQFATLTKSVAEAYATDTVFPLPANLWRALEWVAPADCRAVILGQDPYPTPGYAHGLSFSVPPGQRVPASLRTIFRELQRSVPGWQAPGQGCLEPWARQGVLLLNRILTVQARAPLSHAGWGWEAFTDAVIRHLQSRSDFTVFLLWGAKAQTVRPLIDESQHAVLADSHPSPMAQNHLPAERRFVGNGHFATTNAWLRQHGRPPIDWRL